METAFVCLAPSAHVGEEVIRRVKKFSDPVDVIATIDVHLISVDEVYARYSCSRGVGLEPVTVERRLMREKNIISRPPTQYWLKALNYIFGGFNFLMWIAFVVTLVSYKLSGAKVDLGVGILLILVIAVSTTFYAVVDWNANRIMKSVKSLIARQAVVIRNGNQQSIPANDIVVGDIVMLSTGDRVPADLRIVQVSSDLLFDRSLLTGESDMIPGALDPTSDIALETHNLAFNSTFVTQGNCVGIVFATGDRTIMGRLVHMSSETKFKLTTVQREIWFFTKVISAAAISLFIFSLLMYGVWLRKKYPGYLTLSQAISNSIGCLTSFVPQGLPVCVALSLTIIARRMAKRSILVKNLATIETLGCASVLCTDKTGTLTAGRMAVASLAFLDAFVKAHEIEGQVAEAVDPRAYAGLDAMHKVTRLCNGARFVAANPERLVMDCAIKGNLTDTALLRFSEGLSVPSLNINTASLLDNSRLLFEIPFNSNNKWMLSVIEINMFDGDIREQTNGRIWLFAKGAPEVMLESCSTVMKLDGSVVSFDDTARERLTALQREWSSEGRRVLALCRKPLEVFKGHLPQSDLEAAMYSEIQEDLTLVGLVGICDPPRPDVPAAIDVIRRAGVRVFMVTGDFKLTAVAIARQVGIVTQQHLETIDDVRVVAKKYPDIIPQMAKPSEDDPVRAVVLTGEDVATLSPVDWDVIVASYTEIVFARTTPDQKVTIVENIKARGDNTVAVTGDGVNDAPVLKAADISVVMGSGSDVAKEAAALILLNNDFTSIPAGIEMGRLVFDNLKKVTLYLMPVGSYTEFMAVLTNVLMGTQLPLSAYLQVCFSIANDVVMSIPLMYEKAEADLMLRKPRNARTDRLTDWRLFFQIYLFIGLMTWPCCMAMWFLYMHENGLNFYDVILTFNEWTNPQGWEGKSPDQLQNLVNTGQCIYYVTMVFIQYGNLLAIRNRRVSLLRSNSLWGSRQNLVIPVGMAGTALIAVVNLYGPGLRDVFHTTTIPTKFWLIPFGFAFAILTIDEIRKLIVRTYPKSILAKMAW